MVNKYFSKQNTNQQIRAGTSVSSAFHKISIFKTKQNINKKSALEHPFHPRSIKFLKMDLQDQLKNLFPDHTPSQEAEETNPEPKALWIQDEPMICKFEKRKGKPTTIIEGYTGTDEDFKILAKEIKTKLSVGGTFKDDAIIIQGNYRDKIMEILKLKGFKVKRVGG